MNRKNEVGSRITESIINRQPIAATTSHVSAIGDDLPPMPTTPKQSRTKSPGRRAPKRRLESLPPVAPRLAKLTRPSARGILPRERLFALLDDARHGRAAWIAAGAGAGKTSLVSSWIEARRLPALWFHIDEADADPATFFHYLALAGEAFAPEQPPLTRLTPEYLLDVPTFTRRFFEALFARLPESAVVVFDNLHRVPAEAPLHGLMAIGLECTPASVCLVGLSRAEPSSALARWTADAAFTRLPPAALALTDDEAAALCTLLEVTDQATAERLRVAAQGWAAGLVLMARARRVGLESSRQVHTAPQAVFDYFATEFLAHLPPASVACLETCALLRDIPASLAAPLTGDTQAADLLEELHAARLFVERRVEPDGGVTFEFHPLLHAFLKGRLARRGPENLAALQSHAALLLERAGRIEEAIEAHLSLGNWSAASSLLDRHAPSFLGQGRWAIILGWIRQMPGAFVTGDGATSLWKGSILKYLSPVEAIPAFDDAYRAFVRTGNVTGYLYACAGSLSTHPFMPSGTSISDWRMRLDVALGQIDGFDSPEAEARIIASAGFGIAFSRLEDPLLDRWSCRALALLGDHVSLSASADLVQFLGLLAHWRCDNVMRRTFNALLPTLPTSLRNLPQFRLVTNVFASMSAWIDADPDAGYLAVEAGWAISRESGELLWAYVLLTQGTLIACVAQDAVRLERFVSMHGDLPESPAPGDQLNLATGRCGLALLTGDLERARLESRQANRYASRILSPFASLWATLGELEVMLACGEQMAAREPCVQASAKARSIRAVHLEFMGLVLMARIALRIDPLDRTLSTLRETLRLGAAHSFLTPHPFCPPGESSELFALALDHAIEPDYVRRFIRKRNLAPPPGRIPDLWPFPLRIRTLGNFEVLLDDRPLESGRKLPRRALDLLKVVIAQGGTDVNVQSVVAAIWPDAEGDQARGSFDITLHRLRKLLGADDLLRLDQGRLSLDASRVWIDVRALEALDSTLDETIAQAGDDTDTLGRQATALLDLYRREFLASDDEAPWFLAMRERQRARFVRMADRIGAALAHGDTLDQAITFVQAASDREPLAEPLARRLMLLLESAGRQAEALAVFQRCRQMLSILLATTPSRETEAIAARLRGR